MPKIGNPRDVCVCGHFRDEHNGRGTLSGACSRCRGRRACCVFKFQPRHPKVKVAA